MLREVVLPELGITQVQFADRLDVLHRTVSEMLHEPPLFFQKAEIGDRHIAICIFAHIVDGQQRHAHGGKRFHLNAGTFLRVAGFTIGHFIDATPNSISLAIEQ